MNSFYDSVKSWFGYSRKERRSTFMLLSIIMIILGFRYLFPAKNIPIKEFPIGPAESPVKSSIVIENKMVKRSQEESRIPKRKRALLDLNSCDSASLVALPGIGPVLSVRILKYRNLIGGYVSVKQLKEVYGLPEETYNLIASRVFADSLAIRKISINKAAYKDLIKHPYFKKAEVSAILKFRELKGPVRNSDEMLKNNLVSAETIIKIRSYLDFSE